MAPSVLLLAGDDDLLLLRELERVVAELRDEDPDLAVETYDATETEHLPELRTASLFGGRTCVVLRGLEEVRADLKSELEQYLEAPSEDAVLVLVSRGVGKVQKIARLAAEHGERRDVSTPRDFENGAWDRLAGEEFRRLGRKADATALAAVRAHAGNDPSAIASKVGQVAAAAPRGETITAAHVEAAVEGHGRQSGFALADAVADRDAATALVALRGSLEADEAPLALLGALVYRFRQLLQVRGGGSQKDVRASPGQYRRLQAIATRNFGPGELAWCQDRLAQLDVDLKGSDLPDHLLIELAVIDLATPREVGAPWNPLAAS